MTIDELLTKAREKTSDWKLVNVNGRMCVRTTEGSFVNSYVCPLELVAGHLLQGSQAGRFLHMSDADISAVMYAADDAGKPEHHALRVKMLQVFNLTERVG